VAADPTEWHINAGGGDYTAVDGTLFHADKAYVAGDFGYSGGRIFSFSGAIAGTEDDTLYQTIRSSYAVSYMFDVMGMAPSMTQPVICVVAYRPVSRSKG
jgi:hypothetical protein